MTFRALMGMIREKTMELSDLIAYAKEKYGIVEERGYQSFPNCSVLSHPRSRTWIAFLVRQWDMETGTEIERCDIRCGMRPVDKSGKTYLSPPIRMRGADWIGVALDKGAEPDVVFKLLDEAVVYSEPRGVTTGGKWTYSPNRVVDRGEPRGYTVVIDEASSKWDVFYEDVPLPFLNSSYRPANEVPERIREMRRMIRYAGRETMSVKARNFRRQAVFMQDFEDDFPWAGSKLDCYYATYRDLTINQLRGYFTWRAAIRRGEYQPIPAQAALIYVYELFNGIGASSPEERLRKLKEFEAGYLDSGVGERYMRSMLRRSMMEFAIVRNLPLETVRQYADPDMLARDEALQALRRPSEHSDEEVFCGLCHFAKKKLTASPVLTVDGDRGRHLFCEIWRMAALKCRLKDQTLFRSCFGRQKSYSWFPLSSVVYDWGGKPMDMDYSISECRSYHCRNGEWEANCYENYEYDKDRFLSLIHAADLRLRRYLKTGRYLRDSENDAWALLYIDEVIREDERLVAEASRQKITVDLSGLDQIRKDAIATRNSLLTEEERAEMETSGDTAEDVTGREFVATVTDAPSMPDYPDIPLDAMQIQILQTLLRGEPIRDIIKKNRLMPSMVADAVNEAMFDKIGDTVLSCEDDMLSIVGDYRDDLAQLLGEKRS